MGDAGAALRIGALFLGANIRFGDPTAYMQKKSELDHATSDAPFAIIPLEVRRGRLLRLSLTPRVHTESKMSIPGIISKAVNSTSPNKLNSHQSSVLSKVTDPAQKELMTAQFQLQNYTEMIQTLTQMMKTMHDSRMTVARNF